VKITVSGWLDRYVYGELFINALSLILLREFAEIQIAELLLVNTNNKVRYYWLM